MKKLRLGVFGGAFDPPHTAHLIAAEMARDKFEFNKIIFIPSYMPPHKDAPVASAGDRLEMLKLATKDNPYFEVSDIEIRRKETSYTVDTVKELTRIYHGAELFLIIGMDEAKDFMTWKAPAKILTLCKFVVINRPGFKKEEVPDVLREKVQFLMLNIDISSTKLREFIKNGKSIKYLVPKEVELYIKRRELYK
ncbi:MAG: nicotinate-nucleotide adenylyltransferase [bacterium]|nr:nicotinate-nucleotide adenylyltransferase [bacterium]